MTEHTPFLTAFPGCESRRDSASQTGSYSGYGFAIPTTIMNKVVDDLKKYGNVQRAMIGIKGTDVNAYVDVEKEKGNDK